MGRSVPTICGALALWLLASGAWSADRIRVAATSPVLAHWVQQLGGERVDVVSLLRSSVALRSHAPAVSDVKRVAGSRVLVRFGPDVERWSETVRLRARNSELIVIDALGEGEPAGAGDGLPWLDPIVVPSLCLRIARGLEATDPFAGGHYQKALDDYTYQVRRETARIREATARLAERRVTVSAAGWRAHLAGLGFDIIDPQAGAAPARALRIRVADAAAGEGGAPAPHPAVGGIPVELRIDPAGSATYLELLDGNARALIQALSTATP